MIQIGAKNIGIISKTEKTIWDNSGKIFFKGKTYIGIGSCISNGKNGLLQFGDNFSLTASSTIDCQKEIRFGNNCLLSWDILIMDSDYHQILDSNGIVINPPKSIIIGSDVWIGCRSTLLKGTMLADNVIVAAGSILTSTVKEQNIIIGGSGKTVSILKSNVTWLR